MVSSEGGLYSTLSAGMSRCIILYSQTSLIRASLNRVPDTPDTLPGNLFPLVNHFAAEETLSSWSKEGSYQKSAYLRIFKLQVSD